MKTYVYLFFCLFSLMGFQACSNDEVDNVKTTTSNDVEAVSASSSLITSEEAKNNIPAFTEAIEAENTLLGLSSRATSMDAFSEDYNDYEKEFAFYSILSYAYSSYRYKHLQQRH